MSQRKLSRSNATIGADPYSLFVNIPLDDDMLNDAGSDDHDYADEEELSQDKDLDEAVEQRLEEFFEILLVEARQEIKKQVSDVVRELVPGIATEETIRAIERSFGQKVEDAGFYGEQEKKRVFLCKDCLFETQK